MTARPPGDDLRRAGAAAVTYNAPLGPERARDLAARIGDAGARRVLDLCCGRGALLCDVLRGSAGARGTGVDLDADSIAAAEARARADGVGDRARFEVGDAARWLDEAPGEVDAVACVGGSHAFGGADGMLAAFARSTDARIALIGDGVYASAPDERVVEMLGPLASSMVDYERRAAGAGWRVLWSDRSTLDEWDAFEGGWTEAVRALGTTDAAAFAREREAAYRLYRGVLEFGWFLLGRDGAAT
ncbi:MAG: class I SAM-dependent methyltransferase [Planctomycetota bacterium]